jgi:hypothetical protein
MSDIASLAHQIALAIEAAHPSVKAYADLDRGMVISDYMHDGHASTAQLKTAIAADGSLGHLRQGWLDRGPGGGGIIQDHMLPHVFVVDALGCVDSKDSHLDGSMIQGCFWGGSLGCDGSFGFERRGVGADGAVDHRSA